MPASMSLSVAQEADASAGASVSTRKWPVRLESRTPADEPVSDEGPATAYVLGSSHGALASIQTDVSSSRAVTEPTSSLSLTRAYFTTTLRLPACIASYFACRPGSCAFALATSVADQLSGWSIVARRPPRRSSVMTRSSVESSIS
jgi:hypothetical protein